MILFIAQVQELKDDENDEDHEGDVKANAHHEQDLLAVGDVVRSFFCVEVANLEEDNTAQELVQSQDCQVYVRPLEVERVAQDNQNLVQDQQKQDGGFDFRDELAERLALQADLEVDVGHVANDD